MREYSVVLLESREEYARRLSSFLSLESGGRLTVRTFFARKKAGTSLAAAPANVLVAAEEMFCEDLAGLCGQTVLLCDDAQEETPPNPFSGKAQPSGAAPEESTGPVTRICRYVPASVLLERILGLAEQKAAAERASAEERARMHRAVSLCGAAESARQAQRLAKDLSAQGRTLLWTLCPAGFRTGDTGVPAPDGRAAGAGSASSRDTADEEAREAAAELLYAFACGDLDDARIADAVRRGGAWDVLEAPGRLRAARDLVCGDAAGLWTALAKRGGYRHVVLDAGEAALFVPELFHAADSICLAASGERTGAQVRGFFRLLREEETSPGELIGKLGEGPEPDGLKEE